MSEQVRKVVGLVVLPREDAKAAMGVMCGRRVIEHVVERMRRTHGISDVVVVTDCEIALNVDARVHKLDEAMKLPGKKARAWSGTTWRGGIGGATVYDEVIDSVALAGGMEQLAVESALIVGGTWPVVDSGLCGKLVERHLENPEEYKLVFSQAPPGFAGVVVTRGLMEQMAADQSSIGHMLDYNPQHPQGDPIARDICVQIDASLRQAMVRAIAGAGRWESLMLSAGPEAWEDADRLAARMVARLEEHGHAQPGMVTVEVTTERATAGLLRVDARREEMTVEEAERLFAELGKIDDVAVMFGGVGDVMCHSRWAEIVEVARRAGVKAIGVDTDLLTSAEEVERLIALDVDVVKVRLNADSAQMYERMMGAGGRGLERVIENVQRLLKHRMKEGGDGRPWVVPTMVKTRENVTELEGFVDRWMYYAGAVLVEGPLPPEVLGTGVGALAVIDMAPPRRFACRQLTQRMTVLSDGRIARCDQDVRGEGCVKDWNEIGALRAAQCDGKYEGICAGCRQWHRP